MMEKFDLNVNNSQYYLYDKDCLFNMITFIISYISGLMYI